MANTVSSVPFVISLKGIASPTAGPSVRIAERRRLFSSFQQDQRQAQSNRKCINIRERERPRYEQCSRKEKEVGRGVSERGRRCLHTHE